MRARTFLTTLASGIAIIGGFVFADSTTSVVVASDLQHHRWILESINGEPIPADDDDGMIPELDFGEQMYVEGNTGCNRMSGRAELHDGLFLIPAMATTRRPCSTARNEVERTVYGVLANESKISLDEDKILTLASGNVVLRFRLQDWVG